MTWEKGRQLKKFIKSDGTVIDYTYNANGIRTSKTVGGVKHEYILDGTKILRETWGSNTLIPLYDNEDGVCGILYNNVPYYFIKNLQGDIIAIVDKDAQTVARYSYDAWGACTVKDSAGTENTSATFIGNINPFRYRGYYYDDEIDMYYLQSRYYDPEVGRFVNGDDSGFVILSGDKYNAFIYGNNDPVSNCDLSGFYSSSSLKKESWLFRIASNFGINLNIISRPVRSTILYINLWLVKFSLTISVGLTKNYKAGMSFNFSKDGIGISTNLGLGKGYSLAHSYTLGWTNISRSMSLVYSSKNDGVYVSLDVEFQVSHIATAAIAAACVYFPQFYPVLLKMFSKSKASAITAIQLLVPVVKMVYA